MFTLRELGAEDAATYQAFIAAGARAHPDTLRIAPEDVEASPFPVDATEEGATLVAETSDGAWLGVGTIERERGRVKRRHIAWVVRMYVTRAASGRGVGHALLRALLTRARAMQSVSKVNLTVAAHNAPAIHLYESEGFRAFAREEDAFRDGASRAELSMTVSL